MSSAARAALGSCGMVFKNPNGRKFAQACGGVKSGSAFSAEGGGEPGPDDLRGDGVVPHGAHKCTRGAGEPPRDAACVEVFRGLDIHDGADSTNEHVGHEAGDQKAALEALLAEGDGIVDEEI